MIFMTMTGTTEIDFSFLGLTQCSQSDSYVIATWGYCRNCAVDCTILVPERKYWDRNVSIIKWRLRTGTGHLLQEKPGT